MGWLNMGFKTRKVETKMMNHDDFFLRNAGMLLQEKLIRGGRFPNVARIFSLAELQQATNNFDSSMVISEGEGFYPIVFKGFLPENREIAIKKSREDDLDSTGRFINEILILSRFHHKNVVNLIGYCLETEVPLLVLESINNGTQLDTLLHDQENMRALDWDLRFKIATETANILSYLHSLPPTPIVHRYVEPSNILIGQDFTVKVTGFGGSIVIPVGENEIFDTKWMGFIRYFAPEYAMRGIFTEKSDVYSFGVVLLDLLTTRMEARDVDFKYFCLLDEEQLFEKFDETIVSDGNREQLTQYSKLALACVDTNKENRPSMKEVAIVLEGLRFGGLQMEVAAIILEGLRFSEQQMRVAAMILEDLTDQDSIDTFDEVDDLSS